MITRSRLAVLVALGIAGFVVIQFLPIYPLTNPPVVAEPQWDSPQTRELARRACFDCHSNETVWPWYAQIAPVRWFLEHDAEAGRAVYNLSDWHSGDLTASALARQINLGRMPLPQYLLLHPEARLTDAEKQQLIQGFEASLK